MFVLVIKVSTIKLGTRIMIVHMYSLFEFTCSLFSLLILLFPGHSQNLTKSKKIPNLMV